MSSKLRPSTVNLRRTLFKQASAIVEREFFRDLSLDEIANRVVTSRRQLQRAFHEVGATTFREYLAQVRMQKAAELLKRNNLTVKEISRLVGYRQPAQFAKAFRRHLGRAPSVFRSNKSE